MSPTPVEKAAALGCWKQAVTPEPLSGGLSNSNFLVRHQGERFVVRVGADLPVHGVWRDEELAVSRAAHAVGLSPEVVHAESGALVFRYIEGTTLTPERVRQRDTLERMVPLLHTCHRQLAAHLEGRPLMFWVFHAIRRYAKTLQPGGPAQSLPGLLAKAAVLEQAVGPVDIVFGHNDLLAANWLDDGKRLWLIDWEYAGFNSPLFDLGGLSSNSQLDGDTEAWLLERYFGQVPTRDTMRRYQAMKCASLLREAMWGMASGQTLELDVDYNGYANDHLARFESAFTQFEERQS